MIEVVNLSKSYGPTRAIENLNVSVSKGEIVGFLGPNGAGKTTTMKILTGFMAPTSGSVKMAGFDVFENPIEVKKRIGYLPETPPVYMDMKVEVYLRFVARLKGVEESLEKNVEEALEKTNLKNVRQRLIGNLSKGYRQRVGLAQALVSKPEILILDEPTVGLDPRQVAEVRGLIHQLKGHHTVLLSTHILPEVQASCDRIVIINQGRIIAQEALNELMANISEVTSITFTVRRADSALLNHLQGLDGVQAAKQTGASQFQVELIGESATQSLLRYIADNNLGLIEYRDESSNLEQVFLRLTEVQTEQEGVL